MHMGSIVTDVDASGLVVRDHEGATTRYEVGVVLWTAGVEAPAFAEVLAKATGAERDRAGRILVQPDLTIPGHPEISVIGDLMSLDKLPGVAEVAMQGGLYAGHRIQRLADGTGVRQAVPLPRPGLGRLHLPRQRRHVGGAAADQRLPRLGRLAVHPHRVPDRVP